MIDQGQSILFTATTSNGIGSYTYQYYIINAQTGAIIANRLYSGVAGTTNSFLWTPLPDLYSSNTFKANVVVTDSHPTTVSSAYKPFGYNSLGTLSITASNSVLDSGQYEIFTFTESGATGPDFNLGLYNSTGGNTKQGSNALITSVGGGASIPVKVSSPVSGNVFRYYGIAYDEGTTTPSTFNSSKDSITVNPALSASIAPAANSLILGQSQTWIATVSGGTSPYTYNWTVRSNGAVIASAIYSISSTTNSFTYTPQSAGSVGANVVVTDSASAPVTVNTLTSIITITNSYVPPNTPVITVSNSLMDSGQSTLFSTSFTGGLGPYTYKWTVINSTTDSVLATQSYSNVGSSSNTFLWTPPASLTGGAIEANVSVIDSRSNTANSIFSTPLTIISAPTATILPSTTLLNLSQNVTYTIQLGNGGFGPFNAKLINAVSGFQEGPNATISAPGGANTITFTASAAGMYEYEALITDLGTTYPYTFNTTQSAITVLVPSTTSTTSTSTSTTISTISSTIETGENSTSQTQQNQSNATTITSFTTMAYSTIAPTTSINVVITKKSVANYWYVVLVCVLIAVILTILYSLYIKRLKPSWAPRPPDGESGEAQRQS